MHRILRLKVAREYLMLLTKIGQRKVVLAQISKLHYITTRSILKYVAELRDYRK